MQNHGLETTGLITIIKFVHVNEAESVIMKNIHEKIYVQKSRYLRRHFSLRERGIKSGKQRI